ncbi:hypothetical protein Tco_1347105 [Tanacetum coccineum]
MSKPCIRKWTLWLCSLEALTRLNSSTWATKWFKRLVAYAKCNRDSYKSELGDKELARRRNYAATGSISINRGLIQAIPASLPPQPIGETTKASNLRRIPPGVQGRSHFTYFLYLIVQNTNPPFEEDPQEVDPEVSSKEEPTEDDSSDEDSLEADDSLQSQTALTPFLSRRLGADEIATPPRKRARLSPSALSLPPPSPSRNESVHHIVPLSAAILIRLEGRIEEIHDRLREVSLERIWTLKQERIDIVRYIRRFQELALHCPIMVTPECKMIERVRARAAKNDENKRKWEGSYQNNSGQQNKRQEGSNRGNRGNGGARRRAFVLSEGVAAQDPDVVIGESRLNIISCIKTQKYLQKGCHMFLAHVKEKRSGDKLEDKRLKDLRIVLNLLEVFPKDLVELSPVR